MFDFHQLNPGGVEKSKSIAKAFTDLVSLLDGYCPTSREYSISKTKLEEACFFAKKAMAVQSENQA